MMKIQSTIRFLILSGLAVLAHETVAFAESSSDRDATISRGGRLYADWMVELDEDPPQSLHAKYKVTQGATADVAESWRCVTCHGWDYKGSDAVPSLLEAKKKDPSVIRKALMDDNHGYQAYLRDDDFDDLVRFISEGIGDVAQAIDPSGVAKGDGLRQKPFYETVCATCHGADGQQIAGVSLGRFAVQEPHLSLHSIYNGHPGAVMPSLRAFDDSLLVDLLAYMQALPVNASLVSITRGGRLYDNWMMETGYSAPVGVHPAYPRDFEREIAAKTTWLCVECHGWDYRGMDGRYSEGKHFTGIKGISDVAGMDVKTIVKTLKDRNHEFGAVLHNQDLLDLANFVREGQIDMGEYLKENKATGKTPSAEDENFYPTLCGSCHGEKGIAIRTMPALGRVANENPWKALHKILNGHPAEEMPAWRALDEQVIRDLLTYIQTLPENKRS